jgi:hypothetical protein
MLPLPPIRRTRQPDLREWLRKADAYLLWAFNPQPPLRRTR